MMKLNTFTCFVQHQNMIKYIDCKMRKYNKIFGAVNFFFCHFSGINFAKWFLNVLFVILRHTRK